MAEKLVLLSYPRCGSDWVRYITETLTGLPTTNEQDNPDAIMAKYHHASSARQHPADDRLLLLLRDYREVVLSYLYADNRYTQGTMTFAHQLGTRIAELRPQYESYFANIAYFEQFSGAKEMIYYEDFVHSPARTIVRLGRTLRIGTDKPAEDFIADFHNHRVKSLARKNKPGAMPTKTNGNKSQAKAFWTALSDEQRDCVECMVDEIVGTRWELGRYVLRYRKEVPR